MREIASGLSLYLVIPNPLLSVSLVGDHPQPIGQESLTSEPGAERCLFENEVSKKPYL